MCLIIIKPKGVKFNDKIKNYILESSKSNKDGFGVSYKSSGEYIVSKKFKEAKELIEFINSRKFDRHETLMIHLRMKTHGDISTKNTHPFIIPGYTTTDTSFENMQGCLSTSLKSPVVMHNGIFTQFSSKSENSDTFLFCRDFLNKKIKNHDLSVLDVFYNIKDNKSYDNQIILKKFEKYSIFSNNRVAILHPQKDLLVLGNWYRDAHGVLLSNATVGTKLKPLKS